MVYEPWAGPSTVIGWYAPDIRESSHSSRMTSIVLRTWPAEAGAGTQAYNACMSLVNELTPLILKHTLCTYLTSASYPTRR